MIWPVEDGCDSVATDPEGADLGGGGQEAAADSSIGANAGDASEKDGRSAADASEKDEGRVALRAPALAGRLVGPEEKALAGAPLAWTPVLEADDPTDSASRARTRAARSAS